MLPGTTYTAESVLRILKKRSWMIAIPLVVCSAAAYLYARQLPNLYRSETVLMLMPQRISEGYVKSAINVRVEDRLTTLKEQVLSRPNLEQLIIDFNLYAGERQRGSSLERLVERMRREITTNPEGTGSFRLTYTNPVPEVAKQVTERLAALFNDENLRDRENVAEATNSFLDSQLVEAERRLRDQEKRLEEYRQRYGNELPTQAATNLQSMQGAENRLRASADEADRDRQSRLVIERQLADLEGQDPGLQPAAPPVAAGGDSIAQQLEAARAELARLETRNTADHPDVRTQRRKVSDLQAKLTANTQAVSPSAGKEPPTSSEVARQKRIRDLQSQMAEIDRQLAANDQQQRELRRDIAAYESRLSALPTRESELVELTRNYDTLLNSYRSLSAKREESTLSANLERKNVGEQFRVLDPPRVPDRPFSPDRFRLQLLGSAAGLMLGLGLIGFIEYRDSSFKTEEDVFRVLDLPVLAVIPRMVTSAESATRKKHFVKRLTTLSGMGVVVIGVVMWLWRQS